MASWRGEALKIFEETGYTPKAARKEAKSVTTTKATAEEKKAMDTALKNAGFGNVFEDTISRAKMLSIDKKREAREEKTSAPSTQKDSFGEWAGKQVMSGVWEFDRSLLSTLDAVIPSDFLGKYDFISKASDYYNKNSSAATTAAQMSSSSRGKGWKTAGDVIINLTTMIPNTVLAMLSGGATLGKNAANAISYGTKSAVTMVSNAVQGMIRNPMYWSSALQTLGSDYEEAKSRGASDFVASASAIVTTALNAGIEVGSGIETLPSNLKKGNKNAVVEWVKSLVDEGKEEVVQGIVSNTVAKMYDKNTPIISTTDDRAIINPVRAAKEFGMGALAGGIMGGGQLAFASTVNSVSAAKTGALFNKNADAVQMLIDTGLESPVYSESYKLAKKAEKKLNGSQKLSNYEVGKIYYANVQQLNDEIYENSVYSDEIDSEATTNINTDTVQNKTVPFNVLSNETRQTFSPKQYVSIGDIFKDKGTGNIISILERNAKNTTVQIDTGSKTETKTLNNNQVDAFAKSEQAEKIESGNDISDESTEVATTNGNNTSINTENTKFVTTNNNKSNVMSPEDAQRYNIVVSNLKRKAEELGSIDTNFFNALQDVNLYNPTASDRALISNEFQRVFAGNTDPLVTDWLNAIGVDASSVTSINSENMPVTDENTPVNEDVTGTDVNYAEGEILSLKHTKNIYSVFGNAAKLVIGKDVITDGFFAVPLSDEALAEIKKVYTGNIESNDNIELAKVYHTDNDVVIQGNPKIDNDNKGRPEYVFKTGDKYYAAQQKYIDAVNNGKNIVKANSKQYNIPWTVHDESGNFVAIIMPITAYKQDGRATEHYESLQSVSDVKTAEQQKKAKQSFNPSEVKTIVKGSDIPRVFEMDGSKYVTEGHFALRTDDAGIAQLNGTVIPYHSMPDGMQTIPSDAVKKLLDSSYSVDVGELTPYTPESEKDAKTPPYYAFVADGIAHQYSKKFVDALKKRSTSMKLTSGGTLNSTLIVGYDADGNITGFVLPVYANGNSYVDKDGNKIPFATNDNLKNLVKDSKDVSATAAPSATEDVENGIKSDKTVTETPESVTDPTESVIKKADSVTETPDTESAVPYTDRDKQNWESSNTIIVYESDEQFEAFVEKVLNNEDIHKKIYFGKIPDATAQMVLDKTGVDVSGHNIALKGYEIRKILLNSHGDEEAEATRGQEPITTDDLKNIPSVITNPDDVNLSDKEYEGKPALLFEKTIDGKNYVVAYVSRKHHDIAIQTMYKKRSLSTAENADALSSTPETTSSTASNNIVSQDNDIVNSSVRTDTKNDAERGTGVNTRLVVIDKVASTTKPTKTKSGVKSSRDTATESSRADRWSTDRVADGTESKSTVSVSEIIEQISTEFGIPISTGKVTDSEASGIYKEKPETIRTRISNNLPTISHELGHHLDKKYNLNELGSVDSIRAIVSDEFLDQYPDDAVNGELVAEFVRRYLKNSNEANRLCPEFYIDFVRTLSKEDLAAVNRVAKQVNEYLSYDIDKRYESSVISAKKAKKMQKLPFAERWKNLYTGWVDKFYPLKQITDYVSEIKGSVLSDIKNVYVLATNSLNAHTVANYQVLEGFRDLNGNFVDGAKSLIECIGMVNSKDITTLDLYLKLKHALEVIGKGKRAFADEVLEDTDNIKKKIAKIEKEHPEMIEAANNLYEFQYNMLKHFAVPSGIMTMEQVEYLHHEYPCYVPFYRFIKNKKSGMFAKSSFVNQGSPIMRQTGSGLDTLSHLESIIRNVEKIVKASTRNQTAAVLGSYADNVDGIGQFIEKVAPDMLPHTIDITTLKENFAKRLQEVVKSGDDFFAISGLMDEVFGDDVTDFTPIANESKKIISVMRGGERSYYQIHDDALFSAVAELSPQQVNGWIRVNNMIMQPMKLLITQNNPIFAATNALRDFGTAYKLSEVKNPLTFVVQYAKALGGIITNSEDYKKYKAMGGGHSSELSANIENISKTLRRVAEKDMGKARRLAYSIFRHPVDTVASINDAVESIPRFMEFERTLKENGDLQKAIFNASDITTNFKRSGSSNTAKFVNSSIMFNNAAIQGLDKMFRTITAKDPKKRYATLTKWLLHALIMGILCYLYNKEVDEEGYKNLSSYKKNNFYNFAIGDGKFISLPKPRENALLDTVTERTIEYLFGDNEEAFYDFGSYLGSQLLPPMFPDTLHPVDAVHSVGGSTIFGGLLDVGFNKDFKGTPIEGAYDKYTPSNERYTDSTTKLAYELGQTKLARDLDMSPKKIDHLISSYTGIVGQVNKALLPMNESRKDTSFGLRNKFVSDSNYSTDVLNRMYENQEKAEKAFNYSGSVDDAVEFEKNSMITSYISGMNKAIKAPPKDEQRNGRIYLLKALNNWNYENTASQTNMLSSLDGSTISADMIFDELPSSTLEWTVNKQKYVYQMTPQEYHKYISDYLTVIENARKHYGGDSVESYEMAKEAAKEYMSKYKKSILKNQYLRKATAKSE